MLIFMITEVNLHFLTIINGGVAPVIHTNAAEPTYLVVEPGKQNRVITRKELSGSKYENLESVTRKFWFV